MKKLMITTMVVTMIVLLFALGQNMVVANGLEHVEVDIDIKPCSFPNAVNNDGKGTIPVAILGSADFDVSDIDPTTLSLDGLTPKVKPNGKLQCAIEDVTGPCGCCEPDGYLDLVCHFADDEIVWDTSDTEATLTGELFDGTTFEGSDSIKVVPNP